MCYIVNCGDGGSFGSKNGSGKSSDGKDNDSNG